MMESLKKFVKVRLLMNETEHPLLASAYMEDLELWKYIQQLEKRIDAIDVEEMVRDYGRQDIGFSNPTYYDKEAYRKGVQDALAYLIGYIIGDLED